jgi:hypothetical protein
VSSPKKQPKENVVTIGADPEFFVRRTDTGAPHPIIGLLGGTKGKAIPIGPDGIYGMQEDNVMAEYNIPPCSDEMTFAQHIRRGRESIMSFLDLTYPGQYEPDEAACRVFPMQALVHPQAATFGCSPDFDGYMMGEPNQRILPDQLVRPDRSGAWRFCGGHIHLGYKHILKYELPDYVAAQFADVFLGLTTLPNDKQGERRRFYGTPARYRPTSYGIEYRALSTLWTFDPGATETLAYYALNLARFLTRTEAVIKKLWSEVPWVDVRRAITTEDVSLANSLRGYCNGLGMGVA